MEPTWNRRSPRYEEEQAYQSLIEIHHITQLWLKAIEPNPNATAYRLERFVPPNLVQNLWLLQKLKLDELPPELESVVDANSVREFIEEMEETIWIVQSSVLENALQNTTDPIGLTNLLEQVTWEQGKKVAETRWPNFQSKDFFEALQDSPLWDKNAFLVERKTDSQVSFYWMKSPIAKASLKATPNVLILCQLYHQWIRGFFFGLSKSIQIEITPASLGGKKVWQINLLSSY